MATPELLRRRLENQRAVAPGFGDPAEVVQRLGAVQAQDYRGALWGVALRTKNASEADVEDALARRAIVRTWPMRGTLHFVAPDDVHWMLRHLAPKVIARSARRHRELGLDGATFANSRKVLERALHGGRQLSRPEAYATLEQARISTAGQRGIHILGQLAMSAVLCFGAPKGKQPTFTLLEEWVPRSRMLERDEALAELARRYFASRGPATLQDFAWWTGLTLTDARAGIAGAGSDVVERVVTRGTHYCGRVGPLRRSSASSLHLLPAYDEYTVAYRDRGAILDPEHAARSKNGIFAPVIAIDGRIAGTWGRSIEKKRAVLTTKLFAPPTGATRRALERAVARYSSFLQLPIALHVSR